MARFLNLARRSLSLPLKTLAPSRPFSSISEMRSSAFKEKLLRILRAEIDYEIESRNPQTPAEKFDSFSVDNRPGEQWIRLTRKHGEKEEVKVDVTMVDDAAPSRRSLTAGDCPEDFRLHISLLVEVSKGKESEFNLRFLCSAWPDAMDIEKVFPVGRGGAAGRPFMGPDFNELDEDLQNAVREYLEERGVNDELAEFLHGYMENKDKTEYVRWLGTIMSYVKK